MKSIYNFIIKPLNGRYDNKKTIKGKELVLNSSIECHNFVSKNAVVVKTPLAYNTDIQPGDEVIVHHNVFRRFYDMKGREKNSASFFKEDLYFCAISQIYLYKQNDKLKTNLDYCFVKPILNKSKLTQSIEEPLVGIIKYSNRSLEKQGVTEGTLVVFKPDSEFEFIVNDERLYCMKSNDIVLTHEYQGNEKEYNPSWANSRAGVDKSSGRTDSRHRRGCICGSTKECCCN